MHEYPDPNPHHLTEHSLKLSLLPAEHPTTKAFPEGRFCWTDRQSNALLGHNPSGHQHTESHATQHFCMTPASNQLLHRWGSFISSPMSIWMLIISKLIGAHLTSSIWPRHHICSHQTVTYGFFLQKKQECWHCVQTTAMTAETASFKHLTFPPAFRLVPFLERSSVSFT